jgi:hypothetical protein
MLMRMAALALAIGSFARQQLAQSTAAAPHQPSCFTVLAAWSGLVGPSVEWIVSDSMCLACIVRASTGPLHALAGSAPAAYRALA